MICVSNVSAPNRAHFLTPFKGRTEQSTNSQVVGIDYIHPSNSGYTTSFEESYFRERSLVNSRPNLLSHTDSNFRAWLSQFDNPEEKALMLKVLQNYAYVDIENARKAFHKLYFDLISTEGFDVNKTKFATLGVAKSSSMMGYLFRQANKLRSKGTVQHKFTDSKNLPSEEKFLSMGELKDPKFNKNLRKQGFENLVLIDDIIGNGDSVTEYFTPDIVKSLEQYKNIYYLTLVEDPDCEERVRSQFPDLNIHFMSAQKIYKYDSDENTTFTTTEKQELNKLFIKYGNRIAPELVQKYGRSKLFVSFDWNTPGNSPMVFNLSTDKWTGLFERYNGLEKKDVGTNFNFYG